jgi:cytochrome c553
VVALLAVLVAVGSASTITSSASTKSSTATAADGCVACHTDPEKLRALTRPDPPAAESGEG